jgi:thioester reductase-like protein
MHNDHQTSRPGADASPRRTVLLTGATGVVGNALLPRLRNVEVICLLHRSPVAAPEVTPVHGDVRRSQMGLSAIDFNDLAHRVDAVIHSAAVTDFNRTDGSLHETNVEGTKHVLDFVASAGVPLYHVSTAYLDTTAESGRGRTAAGRGFQESLGGRNRPQRASARHPSSIVIVGDSGTGAISAFQGLYKVAGAILDGAVPLIPFDPAWPIDSIPVDVVADAIATVIDNHVTQREFWLTAGERALRFDEAVTTCVTVGTELGQSLTLPGSSHRRCSTG